MNAEEFAQRRHKLEETYVHGRWVGMHCSCGMNMYRWAPPEQPDIEPAGEFVQTAARNYFKHLLDEWQRYIEEA